LLKDRWEWKEIFSGRGDKRKGRRTDYEGQAGNIVEKGGEKGVCYRLKLKKGGQHFTGGGGRVDGSGQKKKRMTREKECRFKRGEGGVTD